MTHSYFLIRAFFLLTLSGKNERRMIDAVDEHFTLNILPEISASTQNSPYSYALSR